MIDDSNTVAGTCSGCCCAVIRLRLQGMGSGQGRRSAVSFVNFLKLLLYCVSYCLISNQSGFTLERYYYFLLPFNCINMTEIYNTSHTDMKYIILINPRITHRHIICSQAYLLLSPDFT